MYTGLSGEEQGLWGGAHLAGRAIETHLDTGFGGGLSLPNKWLETLQLQGEPRVIGRGRTVNSEFEILGATLQGNAAIAGHEFEKPELVFSAVLDSIDRANIGCAVLRDYAVTFDQKNERVQFLPVARPPAETITHWNHWKA